MKKSLLFLAIVAVMVFSTSAQGQIRNGQWRGQIVVRSGGILADWGLVLLNPLGRIAPSGIADWVCIGSVEHDYRNSPLWGAIFPYSWTQTLEEPNVSERIKTQNPRWWKGFLWPDFDRDYHVAVGYSLGYRWFDFPFAFTVGCRYEWMGLRIPSGAMEGMHHIQNVVPTVGASWRVLGKDGLIGKEGNGKSYESDFEEVLRDVKDMYYDNGWNVNVKVFGDVSYVKNIGYNNPKGLTGDVVNDGLRFAVGMGWEFHVHSVPVSFDVRYEWDGYDLFNVPGVKTHTGRIVGSFGIRL